MYYASSGTTAVSGSNLSADRDNQTAADASAVLLLQKKQKLTEILQKMGSLMIAFSGGTDSTFLLYCASAVLTNKAVAAVTAATPLQIVREIDFTKQFAKQLQISQYVVTSYTQLDDPLFCHNNTDRCYYCKKNLFQRFLTITQQQHYHWLADGTNQDDLHVYRPGAKAAQELGVRHPLAEAGLNKQEIRLLSRQLNLPTWNQPSSACLASRFPYGEQITAEKVSAVYQAEQYLADLGFIQNRVRYHHNLARIELPAAEIPRLMDPKLSEQVTKQLKKLGFNYITLDLQGFRSGSLDEVISK